MALVFKEYTRKMEISDLLNAPLLECLELEFVSVFELKLSATTNVQRHDKPFRFALFSRDRSQHQPLAGQTLEERFGPEEPKQVLGSEFLLHQTLLKKSWVPRLQHYCNAAHTRAVKAKRSREALAPPSCDHRLFEIKHLCEECDSGSKGDRWY